MAITPDEFQAEVKRRFPWAWPPESDKEDALRRAQGKPVRDWTRARIATRKQTAQDIGWPEMHKTEQPTLTTARAVLKDCDKAHEILLNEQKDSPTWRIHWVACLTLLRAVGHVLDKVDGLKSEKAKGAIAAAYRAWKDESNNDHLIFRNFVEEERNNLLKEYRFNVDPEQTLIVNNEGNTIITEQGEMIVADDDYFTLSTKGFENREGRDVIAEAIDWWGKQLDEIEGKLK